MKTEPPGEVYWNLAIRAIWLTVYVTLFWAYWEAVKTVLRP